MKNINAILTAGMLCMSLAVSAQNARKITGVITDANCEPLIGATVKGNKAGTGVVTDLDGKFALQLKPGEKSISISYIGYDTKTVNVGNSQNIKVKLQEQANVLDQLVVIGYGAVKKGSVTASVSSVKGEDLERRPVSNIAAALQGELAGLETCAVRRASTATLPPIRCMSSMVFLWTRSSTSRSSTRMTSRASRY